MNVRNMNPRNRTVYLLFIGLLLIIVVISLAVTFAPAYASSFIVTSSADSDDGACDYPLSSGDCTLREAMNAAEVNGTADTITFEIPAADPGCVAANVCTIMLASSLPLVTESAGLTIDGSSADVTISGGNTVRLMIVGFDGALTLRGLTLKDGYSSSGGAMIAVGDSSLLVEDSTFADNTAQVSSSLSVAEGGAIYASGASLIVRGSTFVNNQVRYLNTGTGSARGAAIFYYRNDPAVLQIENSTFVDNIASEPNDIGYGGALYVYNGSPSYLTQVTFVDNVADSGGDTVFALTDVHVTNTVIKAADAADPDCDSFPGNLFIDGGGNFNNDASCPGTTVAALGLDAALAENGGPTQTIALLAGSPALDAIALVNCPLATDQRGVFRPQGPSCDAGAFELEQDPDPTVLIVLLQGSISELVDDGTLNNGQANALNVKLNQALKLLEQGKPDQAITLLNAFIDQVNGWSGNVLTPATAADLVAQAEAIIAASNGA